MGSIIDSEEGKAYLKSRVRQQNRLIRSIAVSFAAFALVAGVFVYVISGISGGADNREMQYLTDAVNRAAVSCYAIEGRYPPNVDYITQHYGVVVDSARYVVSYQLFASNIPPNVQVIENGAENTGVTLP